MILVFLKPYPKPYLECLFDVFESSHKARMVRMKGLEPSRLATLDPKSSVYTNFTTSAIIIMVPPTRFERVAYALEGRCSIQLS